MASRRRTGWIAALAVCCAAALLLVFSGQWLDRCAEERVHARHPRHEDGVIIGLEPVAIVRGQPQALVLVHGLLDSPNLFTELIGDLAPRLAADIYAPLLPFHGRDLESAARFDNAAIGSYLKNYLGELAARYRTVTVLGLSYGGAQLLDLARRGELPANLELVLAAPAVFVRGNDVPGRLKARVYGWWRDYCDSPLLGCGYPSYDSGDAAARPLLERKISLGYKVIPAVEETYRLDLANRQSLAHPPRPYRLIVAADDNRVDFAAQQQACAAAGAACRFYPFPAGRHLVFLGANRAAFADLLVAFVNDAASAGTGFPPSAGGPSCREPASKNGQPSRPCVLRPDAGS